MAKLKESYSRGDDYVYPVFYFGGDRPCVIQSSIRTVMSARKRFVLREIICNSHNCCSRLSRTLDKSWPAFMLPIRGLNREQR